jgi:hypothetical protein
MIMKRCLSLMRWKTTLTPIQVKNGKTLKIYSETAMKALDKALPSIQTSLKQWSPSLIVLKRKIRRKNDTL